jgi:prevent-host-death family protein
MNKVITIYDAKTNLSKYIKQAKSGHPVYIGSYGEQEVVLMAVQPVKNVIKFGVANNAFQYDDSVIQGVDKDIQELFYGQDK